jgi:signal transduction histidine kinase/ligand-binding sensor domain-containing protein
MLRLDIVLIFILLGLFATSCSREDKRNTVLQSNPGTIKVQGYIVPEGQVEKPQVIAAGKPKISRVKDPVVVKEKRLNKIIAVPEKFQAGMPEARTPGQNGLSKPVRITAKGQPFHAAAPEIVVAQYPGSKDINPHGFSTFGTIQGLKTNQIRCLLQDHSGNLWFSSDEGVTRYDGKYLSHFLTSNGENKNNIILSLMEDQSGNLWLGTFGGGVICFDGEKFTEYTEKDGLSNNIVNCVFQDRSGNYWMATSGGGVSKFDGKEFTHYTTKEGLASDQVRTIFQDMKGDLWFGTFGMGVSRFDGTSFYNYSVREGLPATHLASMMQDRQGNIWFGSYSQGAIKYDGQYFYQYTVNQGLIKGNILCLMQDDEGLIWLGTSGGGISMFDGRSFTNYGEEDGLSNGFIRCELVGKQGNLWFGTRDGGLVRFNKNLFTHYTVSEGLGGNKVLDILQDKKGDLWFALFRGGITRFDGKEFDTYSLKESLLNDWVYALTEAEDGSIWLGSDGGGITKFDGKNLVQYTQNEGLCSNSVRCIIEDRHRQLWIGTYGGGVSMFDGKNFVNYSEKGGLGSDKILALMEDKVGNIWIGTDGGGVTRFDGRTFTRYGGKEGLKSNSVNSILQDKNGELWFGTTAGGVTRFDGEFMTTYTKSEGLSNNNINSMIQDKAGNIWLGSRAGPNILNAEQLGNVEGKTKPLFFKNFSYDDGFLGIGCNLGAMLEDKNGIVWIGSTNRLSAIRPWEDIPDTVPPNTKIINVKLFNENIPWQKIDANKDTTFVLGNGVEVGNFKFSNTTKWYFLPDDLKLAYDNNFLTFNFIGISQKQTPKIRYQYQLEGVEKYWSGITDLTEISYANLKPGNYVFRVKAMNSEGKWSNESQYAFSIRHPWWETWWFYLILFLAAGSLVVIFIKWREHEHEIQKKFLTGKIEEQTQELMEKNQELEAKNTDLQVVNSEKDKFFSVMAHDVRGPLGTFLLFSEIMAQNLKSYTMEEIQVMAESLHKSAATLFELLENLLEWARMQRGMVAYNPEQHSLITVLNDSLDSVHESAKNKAIAVIVDIPSDMEVIADKNMLASIFRNLTSNAIKFTPKGGKVTIKAIKSADKFVEISVADTGIGMEEKMLGELFKIDVSSNRKGTDGETSIGLGLLLCRDFVEKMGGRIWAESKVDHGSIFHFTLKLSSGR